ncbi:MAG: hypothetical protein IKY83_08445 [Proteobacteria bacterium]|nr:hypothetical protein [Pseudomonadota bacterium]
MKFDKRFVLSAALVLGLGLSLTACGDDDKKDDDKPADPPATETCGNGVLDEGEVCDMINGKAEFAESKGTCQLWYDENKDTETSPLVNDPEARPGCAKNCMAHSKGDCKTEASVLCGDGIINGDEVCDIGLDGNAKTEDDVIADGKTCNDYQQGEWKEGGKPSCAKDCKGYGAGTCVSAEVVDTDIQKCTAKVTYDAENKKATAEVTVESEIEYTTSLLCATNSNKLAAALDGTLSGSNEFDASAFTDAGDYSCIVVVVANDKKSLCSENGDVLKVGGEILTFADAAVGSFKIESQVSADTIAKWTFVDYNNTKDDPKNIASVITAGIAPEEGTASELKLTWIPLGDNASKIAVKMTADNSGVNNSLTALQLNTSGASGYYGDSQKADESSHLSITDLSGYSITSMAITAKYEDSKLYITEVANEAETVVKTLELTKAYTPNEITGFTADAKAINIYADNASGKAPSIDDITLVGAAK